MLVKLTPGFCSLKSFEETANGIIKKNETIDYFATTGVNWCSYEQITLVRFGSLSHLGNDGKAGFEKVE